MPAEARVTKLWKQQKGLVPFLFIGFAAYFLYDGFVGYPFSDERWDAHERVKAELGAWEALCKQKGWSTEVPEHRLGPDKYREQFWFGGVIGTIGVIALVYWMRQRRSVVSSDDGGVTTPSGRRVLYSAITLVDKRRWKSKGFAYVEYLSDGEKRRFTLDDAKHDPKALDIILTDIATHSVAKVEEPVPEDGETA